MVAKKIKQIIAQDNKSAKAQEDTRQMVYDRKGNLVGELTLKERLINELAVEIAEGIEAPLMAEADEILSGLKERPLRVNEKQEAEIRHQFGTLANFRKDTGIRLVSENSEIADGLWDYGKNSGNIENSKNGENSQLKILIRNGCQIGSHLIFWR